MSARCGALAASAALAWLALAGFARAHGVEPSILDLTIHEGGRVDVAWTEPTGLLDGPGLQLTPDALRVDFPAGCAVATPRASRSVARGTLTRWSMACGGADARAPGAAVRVPGLAGTAKLVIARVREPGRAGARIELLTGRRDALPLVESGPSVSAAATSAPGRGSESGPPRRWGATLAGAAGMVLAARGVRTARRTGRAHRTALTYALGVLAAVATGLAVAGG